MNAQHGWMQTFGGTAFDPLNPVLEDIHISDIAHHLSLTCRYSGAVQRFYSVAEHSVLVARAVPPEHFRWGLLHDATEAYIADLVRPIKHRMPEYRAVEDNLMAFICTRFGLPLDCPPEVHDADLRIVVDEKAALLGPEPKPWNAIAGCEPLGVEVTGWLPEVAEQMFLASYYEGN